MVNLIQQRFHWKTAFAREQERKQSAMQQLVTTLLTRFCKLMELQVQSGVTSFIGLLKTFDTNAGWLASEKK